MGLTEGGADFLDSLTALASSNPLPPPLKDKKPHARPNSNSLGSYTNPYKRSLDLAGPPSTSVSSAAGPDSASTTNLASSLWPHEGKSIPLSFLSSPTLPEPGPNSEVDTDDARLVYLPPISPSRRSTEPLPPLIPRLSRPPTPSTPSVPSIPSTTPTPPKEGRPALKPFSLRPSTVNWEGNRSGSSSKKGKEPFWTAIQDAGVPVYLSTPGFDGELESSHIHTNVPPIICAAFTLCPSALGTYCSPSALLAAFSDIEVFYHVYAAGQKLTREDLWVLCTFW